MNPTWLTLLPGDIENDETVAFFERRIWDRPENVQDLSAIGNILGVDAAPLGDNDGRYILPEGMTPQTCCLSFERIIRREGKLYATFTYGTLRVAPLSPIYKDNVTNVYLWPVSEEQVTTLRQAHLVERPKRKTDQKSSTEETLGA